MKITANTPIPTEARPFIRHIVKTDPRFDPWSCGLFRGTSRTVGNRTLMLFAVEHPNIGRRVAAAIALRGGID